MLILVDLRRDECGRFLSPTERQALMAATPEEFPDPTLSTDPLPGSSRPIAPHEFSDRLADEVPLGEAGPPVEADRDEGFDGWYAPILAHLRPGRAVEDGSCRTPRCSVSESD